MRELFSSWEVEHPSTFPVGPSRTACVGCAHPSSRFELLDAELEDFDDDGCSLLSSFPAAAFAAYTTAASLLELEGCASWDLIELLDWQLESGRTPFDVDAHGRLLVDRMEVRVREVLSTRRSELVSHVLPRYPGTPLDGPLSFLHFVSYDHAPGLVRTLATLYRQVSPVTAAGDAVFLVPERLFKLLEEFEYAESLEFDHSAFPLLLADWEGIEETALFVEGDLELLDVISGLLLELGLSRAVETARTLAVLP